LRAGLASGGGRDQINKGKRLMGEKGRMNNEEEKKNRVEKIEAFNSSMLFDFRRRSLWGRPRD
jgi:hypothetical protein